MTQPLYGLRRGKQWVQMPSAPQGRRRPAAVPIPADLWLNGEPLFVPGLTLADGREWAWVTPSSELAERRCRLLRMVPPGWCTRVERVA